MNIQVLVAAMHQKDHQLLQKMNIQTDVIVGNQADCDTIERFDFNGLNAVYLTFNERGVGLNRNNALMRATADICLIADDDVVYVDEYSQIINRAFEQLPQADGIIFNIMTDGYDYGRRQNKRIKRIRWYNSLNYGAVRLAVKRASVVREGIMFNTNFGGGTKYSAGEDTLFINSMLRKKLKLYTYPVVIATVDQTTSTWFEGYTEKFYYDKGALFCAISKFWSKPLCLQYLIRHRQYAENGMSFFKVYKLMKQGIKGYGSLQGYAV